MGRDKVTQRDRNRGQRRELGKRQDPLLWPCAVCEDSPSEGQGADVLVFGDPAQLEDYEPSELSLTQPAGPEGQGQGESPFVLPPGPSSDLCFCFLKTFPLAEKPHLHPSPAQPASPPHPPTPTPPHPLRP